MNRVVITGASGWVGRAMIETLIAKYGQSILDVVELYGSKEKSITTLSGLNLKVRPLNTIDLNRHVDIFAPLAFLTQEKYGVFGKTDYERISEEIISIHSNILNSTKPNSTLYFSSGITSTESENLSRPESFLRYKELKVIEEKIYKDLIAYHGGCLITCRLFSMSGRFMADPAKYALGNFIHQALNKNKIEIYSNKLTYRKYVLDTDLCTLMLELANHGKNVEFESTGSLVELGDLAFLVAQHFNLSDNNVTRARIEEPEDRYFSSNSTMDELFLSAGLRQHPLQEQISITIQGIKGE